jgi:hypothetical protein
MASITTRATKGSALTWTEADNNITNLNTAKLENVVEDLTPQLGGDLDVNGKNITSASNGTINITPNGSGNISLAPATGKIILGALEWPTSTGSNGQVLTTNGSTAASWTTVSSGGIADVVEDTTPQLGGTLDLNGYSITSNAAGNITIDAGTDKNIALRALGTGHVDLVAVGTGQVRVALPFKVGDLVWPSTTGTSGYVLSTNGTNTLSWTNTVASASTATSAGIASQVTLTADNTTNATEYPLFSSTTTGNVSPRTDTGFTYNPSTGVLTATQFTGVLSGTATNATNINISTADGNTNDSTLYPVMVGANATGNQAPHIDGSGLAFNASTNTLTLGSSSANSVGALALNTASAAFSVTLRAPALSSSYTLTLPTDDGSASGLLQTNGSGTLTWSNAINSTSIGATTAAAGTFTTMTAATAVLDDIRETVAALTYGATITPNAADGSIRTITLTGNVTFSAFTTPVSGQTITLIITQDATGSRTLTSTMKFAGGLKTLSTAANSIYILTVSYIGTTYYASLAKGFA